MLAQQPVAVWDIVSADFMNLCSEYGVTLNLSYGGLYRKFVDSFRRLCDF